MIQLTFEEDMSVSSVPLRFMVAVDNNDTPLSQIRSIVEPDIGSFVFLWPQADSLGQHCWVQVVRGSEKSVMVSEVATSMTGDTKKRIEVMIRKQGWFVSGCFVELLLVPSFGIPPWNHPLCSWLGGNRNAGSSGAFKCGECGRTRT